MMSLANLKYCSPLLQVDITTESMYSLMDRISVVSIERKCSEPHNLKSYMVITKPASQHDIEFQSFFTVLQINQIGFNAHVCTTQKTVMCVHKVP